MPGGYHHMIAGGQPSAAGVVRFGLRVGDLQQYPEFLLIETGPEIELELVVEGELAGRYLKAPPFIGIAIHKRSRWQIVRKKAVLIVMAVGQRLVPEASGDGFGCVLQGANLVFL